MYTVTADLEQCRNDFFKTCGPYGTFQVIDGCCCFYCSAWNP